MNIEGLRSSRSRTSSLQIGKMGANNPIADGPALISYQGLGHSKPLHRSFVDLLNIKLEDTARFRAWQKLSDPIRLHAKKSTDEHRQQVLSEEANGIIGELSLYDSRMTWTDTSLCGSPVDETVSTKSFLLAMPK